MTNQRKVSTVRYRGRRLTFVALSAAFQILCAAAQADPLNVGNAGAIYRLGGQSEYQEGCFSPCMCPIMTQQGVRGTFRVAYAGATNGIHSYQISDVNFLVPSSNAGLRIVGGGKYSIGSPSPITVVQQRMELDLRVGGDGPQHFDSGWVPLQTNSGIFVTVSINGMYCWDRVITIDAQRVPNSEIIPYALSEGATYQFGCFGLCDCAIQPERPMRGTFALVSLSNNPLFQDFAVVDVHWEAIATNVFDAVTLRGAGIYRVGGEVAVQQRMILDLAMSNSGAVRFDSGTVSGGGTFPHLNIEVPQENLYNICSGSKLHVVADPNDGESCGGFAGIPCNNPNEFCKLPTGECCCDFMGTCTPIAQACPQIYSPVCGCDGITYGNECEAEHAAMSIAHFGACQPQCVAIRDLNDPDLTYCPGHQRNVRINLAFPNNASAVAVEEIVPMGWTALNISNGGVYDTNYGKIKWGPFFQPFPTQLSYDVIPADLTNAGVCFSGSVSIDGSNQSICGDECITIFCCPALQADVPRDTCPGCPSAGCSSCGAGGCNNGNVSLCELIAYACAWMKGCNDDMSGMTRAAYLWRNGECYCWDGSSGTWLPSPCDDTGPACCGAAASGGALIGDGGAAVAIPQLARSSRNGSIWELSMSITIRPPAGTSANALEIEIPKGWRIASISDGGQLDAANAKVKWGPFMDGASRTVTLKATSPTDRAVNKHDRLATTPSLSSLRGTVSFDGINHPIAVKR